MVDKVSTEISLRFKKVVSQFTNPDIFLYVGESRDKIPDDVKHVKVDSAVKIIGWDAFARCKQLETIELHDGIIRISGRSFIDCYALRNPRIPPGVKEIGDLAFSSCLALSSLYLPEGLEKIGRAAFPSCSFRNARIPLSLKEIGEKAFSCCTDIVSLEIPEGVTVIHKEAFYQCLELRNVAIPSTVNFIGDNAFGYCFKLHEKFPDYYDLVNALKTRFDNLPLHKLCYYQSYHPTATTINALVDVIKSDSSVRKKREDCLGMTPLHILGLSKKQEPELYQLLVERYPGDILIRDAWGCLPIYYVCLSDAPIKIVRYFLAMHRAVFPKTKLERTQVIDSFSILFVSVDVLRCVILWTIADRLESLGHRDWKIDILHKVDQIPDGGRRAWKEKERQIALIHDMLALYEQKEVASLLELSAWKAKLSLAGERLGIEKYDDAEESNDKKSSIPRMTDEIRRSCRINSGSELIISNVLPFIFPKKTKWKNI
jgi:hypothetical protein